MRLFAEEKTGYAVPLFSVDKSTASLLVQLVAMETWVRLNVPHGHFRLLRTDFGSEYATQGHGDNDLVAALQAFIAERPYSFGSCHARLTRTLSTRPRTPYTKSPATRLSTLAGRASDLRRGACSTRGLASSTTAARYGGRLGTMLMPRDLSGREWRH